MNQLEMALKTQGMDLAAQKNKVALMAAKEMAVYLAEKNGQVSIEDVREALPHLPVGNWMGSVFKGSIWDFTGEWEVARHKGSHGRPVRVWRLREAA